jgi:glutathione S-transferase
MSIVLFHHPFSRAAGSVWQLEEVGVAHELSFVDILAGAQKSPEIRAMNPMGKLPILRDGGVVVTEAAAIGLYLADRYAPGRLAPTLDDPDRGRYLRWSCFTPAVIEPAVMAHRSGWKVDTSTAGWGEHAAMLDAAEHALEGREYVLGDRFSMADIIFGGTLTYLMSVGLIEKRPTFTAYAERLAGRPAHRRANERNAAIIAERGLAA